MSQTTRAVDGRRRDRSGHRLVEQVAGLCARAHDPMDLLAQVASAVRPVVPYTTGGWLLVDPDTTLVTGVVCEGVTREQHLAVSAIELAEDDVNKFWELSARGTLAASLWATTGGDLALSTRWARVYGPAGHGDELRTVFRSGRTTWGHGCLTRGAGDAPFDAGEVDLLARLCPHVGNGLRAGLLVTGPPREGEPDGQPAVLVLDGDEVESAAPQVEQWLGPLDDDLLSRTIVLHQVAQQVRLLSSGTLGPPARARTRSVDGRWLVVRGTLLDRRRVALVLEPADRSEVAPLLLHLHQLTGREQEVTRLLLAGMPIAAIAQQLWITSETLRGHVKSVYAKLGVRSRPELAALLSPEPEIRVRPPA